MIEEWRIIEDHPNYMVSTLGRVKYIKTDHILKNYPNTQRYACVKLNNNDYRVHRLVAEAFLPNPNNYPQVNHKDENKMNASADNLEWCSASYNVRYSKAYKIKNIETGEIFETLEEAKFKYPNLRKNWHRISKNPNQTFYGYHWVVLNGNS